MKDVESSFFRGHFCDFNSFWRIEYEVGSPVKRISISGIVISSLFLKFEDLIKIKEALAKNKKKVLFTINIFYLKYLIKINNL